MSLFTRSNYWGLPYKTDRYFKFKGIFSVFNSMEFQKLWSISGPPTFFILKETAYNYIVTCNSSANSLLSYFFLKYCWPLTKPKSSIHESVILSVMNAQVCLPDFEPTIQESNECLKLFLNP